MYEDFFYIKLLVLPLQTQCQPHITEAAKKSVEGICKKMYTLSVDYAQKIKERNAEILKEHNISGTAILRVKPVHVIMWMIL